MHNYEIIRDRDYIKDKDGNYLRVVGDIHPKDYIVSFVKYYPNKFGTRDIRGEMYGYNTFVAQSLIIMKEYETRIMYSKYHGDIVTVTPRDMIYEHYSCRKKVKQVLECQENYKSHTVGRFLIDFISIAKDYISLDKLGITGSFLFDAHNEKSDIDLVCYGHDAYEGLYALFKNNEFIQCYEDGLQREIYARRMTHMSNMDFGTLILQESRKLQGVVRGTNIHINCQPLRDNYSYDMDLGVLSLGEIECVIRILEDSQGMYSPSFYQIEVLSIINGVINNEMKQEINYLISYVGDFAQVFRNGDLVYVDGKVVRIARCGGIKYGIEMTAWNTTKRNSAILLR